MSNIDAKLLTLFDAEISKLPKNAAKSNIDAIMYAYNSGMKWKAIAEVLSKHLGQKVSTSSVRDAFYEKFPDKKPVSKKKVVMDGKKIGTDGK